MFSARPLSFCLTCFFSHVKPQPMELNGSNCTLLRICLFWMDLLWRVSPVSLAKVGVLSKDLSEHRVSITRAYVCLQSIYGRAPMERV